MGVTITHFGVIQCSIQIWVDTPVGIHQDTPFGVPSPFGGPTPGGKPAFAAPTLGDHPHLRPILGLTHLWASASPRGPISRNSRIDRGSSGSAAFRSTRFPPGASSSPSRGLPPAAPRNRTSRNAMRIPCGSGARDPAGGARDSRSAPARDESRHSGGSLHPIPSSPDPGGSHATPVLEGRSPNPTESRSPESPQSQGMPS